MEKRESRSDWNPGLYLKFGDERTQPSVDLVSRIKAINPRNIIDVGCGPGNSTMVLANRWPEAEIYGLDSSRAMIEKARLDYPEKIWLQGDILDFVPEQKYGIVFSNAVLQWIPDHEKLVSGLFDMVDAGGALAVQISLFSSMTMGKIIEDVSSSGVWQKLMEGCSGLFTYNSSSFYYNLLAEKAGTIEMWETSYIHVMDSHQALLDWIRSTGLKPYLDRLPADEMKRKFEQEILEDIKKRYRAEANGKVLFPFLRLFFIAYK